MMLLSGVPTPALHLQEWALWAAAVVAGLTALGWIGKRARAALRRAFATWRHWESRLDLLDRLVTHELQPNTGSSMKDALQRVERRQEQHMREAALMALSMESRIREVEHALQATAEAQAAVWPAIQAVAEAEPPHNPHDHEESK